MLADPMADGDLALAPLAEAHRAALCATCALDRDIWPIYAISYDPDHFDASFDSLVSRPNSQAFAILLGGELVGMSAYLGIEAERGVLPPGYVSGYNARGDDTGPGWGWAALLLPYLDQEPLYLRIDLSVAVEDPRHADVLTSIVKTFVCPADSSHSSQHRSRTRPLPRPAEDRKSVV